MRKAWAVDRLGDRAFDDDLALGVPTLVVQGGINPTGTTEWARKLTRRTLIHSTLNTAWIEARRCASTDVARPAAGVSTGTCARPKRYGSRGCRRETAMVEITGAHHIALTVTEADRSAEWYGSLLGMSVVLSGEDENVRFRVLHHPGSGWVLGVRQYLGREGGSFDEFRTGLDHLAFSVETRAGARRVGGRPVGEGNQVHARRRDAHRVCGRVPRSRQHPARVLAAGLLSGSCRGDRTSAPHRHADVPVHRSGGVDAAAERAGRRLR